MAKAAASHQSGNCFSRRRAVEGAVRSSVWSYPGGSIDHAFMPPHQPDGFTSTSRAGSIGVSFTGHRRAVRQYRHGPVIEGDIQPGSTFLTSSADLRWLRIREPSESLEIYPGVRLIRAVAKAIGGSGSTVLPDLAGVDDPVIWSVAAAFRAMLLGGSAMSELEIDTTFRLLIRHVLVTYGGLSPRLSDGRLDARRLARVAELVEARLESRLLLAELAEAAALSPFHFLRAFRRTTGLTPHAYVTARRMERALRLVLGTRLAIPAIAARLAYANPAHFRQAFRKAFGMAPGQIRQ
jgi:AraC family transcriptional regulator